MQKKYGISIVDGDLMIDQENSWELLQSEEKWIVQTTYNRVLNLVGESATGIIFVDFPLWRNLLDAIVYFKFNEIKKIIHYQKVKRPWLLNRLEQFGVEKQIVTLKTRRAMREFIKQL